MMMKIDDGMVQTTKVYGRPAIEHDARQIFHVPRVSFRWAVAVVFSLFSAVHPFARIIYFLTDFAAAMVEANAPAAE